MKKLIFLILLCAGVYYFFDDLENMYHSHALQLETEQAYAEGNIPSPEVFKDLVDRAMIEDLIASGRFTREEANNLIRVK